MAGRRVHFVMSEDLLSRIDAALDGESRGEFVRRAVEQALSGPVMPRRPNVGFEPPTAQRSALPTSGGTPPDGGSAVAAPAEQPLEVLRREIERNQATPVPLRHGHVGPKRGSEPRPKGGKS